MKWDFISVFVKFGGESVYCEDELKDKMHGDWTFGKNLMLGGWSTGSATKAP